MDAEAELEFGRNEKLGTQNGKNDDRKGKAGTDADGENTNSNADKKANLLHPLDSDAMLKHKRVASDASSVRSSGSRKSGSSRASKGKVDKGMMVGTDIQLPQRFVVKYLGFRETTNLWGIKYTRKPVDEMVGDAKRLLSTSKGKALPLLKLEVVEDGIVVGPMPQNTNPNFPSGKFAIQSISYGVQDLVYTRVFAMIVVRADAAAAAKKSGGTENGASESHNLSSGPSPFRCHAFVTDTRETAKNLTYALASAFQIFSRSVAAKEKGQDDQGAVVPQKPAKFAIDLRSESEMQEDLMDSEA